jgi:branched-chain amino acid transport system substrate-binding protein
MIDAFTQTFTAAGGEIVGQEFTPFQKTQDFGPYLAKAKASGADAVYVFYAGGEAISFVKQYDSFGLKATCRSTVRAS